MKSNFLYDSCIKSLSLEPSGWNILHKFVSVIGFRSAFYRLKHISAKKSF